MASLIRALEENSVPYVLVHCGQHYDYEMSQQFIRELELPKPDFHFKVRAYSSGLQTGRILTLVGRVIKKVAPKLVLVEGDTNRVLASVVVAVKLNVPVGHVEAGLRSFDLRMPEEHNRRLVDHVPAYMFAPTENARKNLERESVWGKIHVTGNTVIDTVIQHLPIAERKSTILECVRFEKFALVTAPELKTLTTQRFLRASLSPLLKRLYPLCTPFTREPESDCVNKKYGRIVLFRKCTGPTACRILRLPRAHEEL